MEERELGSRSPNMGLCPSHKEGGAGRMNGVRSGLLSIHNSCLLKTPPCKLNPVF